MNPHSQGWGGVPEQRTRLKKVPPRMLLSAIEWALPVSVRSLYRAVQRGRSPSWLSHVDPSGLPTREYWVDVQACLTHYRHRGVELRLEVVEQ